jgi:hypothetical protein
MRRFLIVGLTGLFLLTAVAMTGCDSRGKADIPQKTIEVPKQGPVPAGAPAGRGEEQKKTSAAQ